MIHFSSSSEKTIHVIGYFRIYYKVIPVSVFVFLHLALFYLRSINIEFDDRLKKANNELKRNIEQLKEAQGSVIKADKMASIGLLSTGMAHEINNPLNFIKGGVGSLSLYVEKLFKEKDAQVKICLDIVNEGVERISKIIHSLGHFSRTGSDMNENCDIHDIIDNCLVILEHNLKNRIEIKKNYYQGKVTVKGNEGRLHQAFLNILSNAEEACVKQGLISIKSYESEKHFHIEIQDNGVGIKESDLNRIIEPFYTTKEPGQGTGLGLSISYNIIEEHGGIIEVKSDNGNGAVVSVLFTR
ncbi:MAG: HAMP domain-containing histidine kinase [Reichenbachiella sp.]